MIEIFAHRGASAEAPDNSPEAIRKALAIGVEAIEIDCRLSQDRIPIVAHDDPHQTWKEAKAAGIASLKEILEIIKPTPTKIVLDIKKSPLPVVRQALAILPPDRFLASSFSWLTLLILKILFPQLALGFILRPHSFKLVPPELFGKLVSAVSLHPCLKGLKKDEVQKWQRGGFKIYTWTVNREEDLKRCAELGVDGIFTDNPRLAKEVLKNA